MSKPTASQIACEPPTRSHSPKSSAAAREVSGLVTKNDGNNVNLDREARLLSENALRFNIAANLLHSKLKIMKMAIEGGGSGS